MGGELVVSHAVVSYKQPGRRTLTAVDGISFDVQPGEVVGLVGESGCGKSTTARAVCGLTPLSAGSITFDGNQVTPLGLKTRPAAFRQIQMVFQNPYASLNPHRRVGEQIEDGRRANPDSPASVHDLLSQVELPASASANYPHQFSGGQRQRIAIARAIACGPRLLIGDEPIASLDASLQARLAHLMRQVALDAGSSLLFISHDLAVVRTIADRIIVMNKGRIVESGPTERVWNSPRNSYTRQLLGAIPRVDGLGTIPLLERAEQRSASVQSD